MHEENVRNVKAKIHNNYILVWEAASKRGIG